MRIWMIGLALGLASAGVPQLPVAHVGAPWWLFAVAFLSALLAAAGRRLTMNLTTRNLTRLASGVMVGYLWSMWTMVGLLDARLPACVQDQRHALLVEVVADPSLLPGPIANSVRLYVRVLDQLDAGCADVRGRHLRLSWYGAADVDEVAVGQRWWIEAQLKEPWGYRNPGGFDYTRWMLGRRLDGSGYILDGRLDGAFQPAAGGNVRGALRRALADPALAGGGIIYALTTGDGSLISDETWDALRGTGTVHLMVVSGLHVGLVAAIGYFAGALVVRVLPLVLLWLPANWAGTITGLVTSAAYVALTGGGVPGQRAWMMAATFMLLRLRGRRGSPLRVLLLVFIAVLLVNPAAVHQQGFWLSFAAVTTLLWYFHGRLQAKAGWQLLLRAQLRIQLALALGLTPWLALLTGEVPIIGPLANFLIVPPMSFAVLPGSLLSAVTFVGAPGMASWGFVGIDWLITGILALLARMSDYVPLLVGPGFWWASTAVVAATALLWGLTSRSLIVVLLLWFGWTAGQPMDVAHGEFRVMALDVGQGSAIVVDTRRHRLLFDAGPGFPSGYDLGASVIVPSILATGPPRLDALVLSHADLDHTGGAAAVRATLPVARTFGSYGVSEAERCSDGLTWNWDGIRFEFLNAYSSERTFTDNDRSCVLRIANATRSALLGGDISVRVEAELGRKLQRVDLLFAPHHGSRSSSSKAFVRLSSPGVVFVSAGYRNRFGHPHPVVMRRYQENGARVYVTGRSGALIWNSQRPAGVAALRAAQLAPYWASPAPPLGGY